MLWPKELDDKLRQYIEIEMLSYQQAAEKLGLTKNQANGRGHRLGLRASGSYIPKSRRTAFRAPIPVAQPEPADTTQPQPFPLVYGLPAALVQRQREQCNFPLGEVTSKDFHYCPATHYPGELYCKAHMLLTHPDLKLP